MNYCVATFRHTYVQMYCQRLAAGKYARKKVSRQLIEDGEHIEIDYFKEALATYSTALYHACKTGFFPILAAKARVFIADAMMESMKLEGKVVIHGVHANDAKEALRLFREARESAQRAGSSSFYLYCRAKELHALCEMGRAEEAKKQFHDLALLSDSRYVFTKVCEEFFVLILMKSCSFIGQMGILHDV